MDSGVSVAKLPNPALEQVLTTEALAFLVALERKFGPERLRLTAKMPDWRERAQAVKQLLRELAA